MIQSMTGFGTAEGRVGNVRVTVELRTVNHRFFNPSIKIPTSFARWEGDVREALRQRIARGHVSVSVRVVREGEGASGIDEAKFAAYVDQLRSLQQRHGLAGDVDVGTVLRMPEVFVARGSDGDEESGSAAELVAVVNEAAAALTAMRRQEGARLAAYLVERVGVVEEVLARIAARAPDRLVEQRDRLREAVRELTGGVAVDEQRLAQEIAYLAERWDVNEELVRFRSHNELFRELMAANPEEPVGKRLSFLVQEMHREANTIGSKANHAGIAHRVVAIKEEVERLREQVENVE
jgi:uncharacterized protein (TIGR00255 family)